MKKLLIWVMLIIMLWPITVLASDTSDADFYGAITVSNNSTAATEVSTVFTCNSTALINTGLVNSSLTDTAIITSAGADVAYMPGYDGNKWCLWVPSIGENSYISDILYLGGDTDMEAKLRYFPDTTGMDVADNAAYEPGDNFTLEASGYFTTTFTDNYTDRNIGIKLSAVKVHISDAEDITAVIGPGLGGNPTIDNADMELNSDWLTGGGTTGRSGTQKHGGTYSWETSASSWAYQDIVTDGSYASTSITFTCWIYVSNINGQTIRIDDGVGTTDSAVPGGTGAWEQLTVNRTLDSAATRLRVIIRSPNADGAYFDDAGITNNSSTASVVVTDISNGEHDLTVRANGTLMEAMVDDDNLIWNSDCEIGDPPTYYTTAIKGTISRDGTTKKINSYSYKLVANDAGGAGASYGYHVLTDQVGVILSDLIGETVTLGFWYYCPSANDKTQKVRLDCYPDGIYWTDALTQDDAWHWDSITMPIGATASRIRLDPYAKTESDADIDDVLYLDGIKLVIGSSITETTSVPSSVALGGVSAPDNANDFTFFQNMGAYWDSCNMTVDGNEKFNFEWEYGSTFTDTLGNGYTATPSFRTTSSDANVSAALSSLLPVEEAKAPAYTLSSAPDFITTTPGMTGDFVDTISPTYPGRDIVRQVAIAGAVPEKLPTILIFTCILFVLSFGISALLKRMGSGSLVIKTILIGFVMAIYVALGIYEVWMVYFFGIMALGIMWMSRQREAY